MERISLFFSYIFIKYLFEKLARFSYGTKLLCKNVAWLGNKVCPSKKGAKERLKAAETTQARQNWKRSTWIRTSTAMEI